MRPEEATIEVAKALKELTRATKELCANVAAIAEVAETIRQAHAGDRPYAVVNPPLNVGWDESYRPDTSGYRQQKPYP